MTSPSHRLLRRALPVGSAPVAIALLASAASLAAACGDEDSRPMPAEPPTAAIGVLVPEELAVALAEHLGTIDGVDLAVRGRTDPLAARADAPDVALVAVVLDVTECRECYRLDRDGEGIVVHASDVLGAIYGLADTLEQAGLGFYHPDRTFVPSGGPDLARVRAGGLVIPERAVRGLHVHTLHPIEAFFDLWEPGDTSYAGAARLLDWIARNRGNYLKYYALTDVTGPGERREAWRAHTRRIVDRAHRIGVRVGISFQLFGKSNLQRSFDLTDDERLDPVEADRRLAVLDGLGYDEFVIAFGEFFAADADAFVRALSEAMGLIRARFPDIPVGAIVHVGNYPHLRVRYAGEEQLYYFLVRYADPPPVPWVHTVMYYTLFEDAGGAYLHDDFFEHRDFLASRLRDRAPVVYYPESAYWVAFDINVPTHLPLYVRSRHTDLARIKELADAAGHDGDVAHVLFSSGWEWGYWQNDVATLRASHTLPTDHRASLEEVFHALGEPGARVAAALGDVADAQHMALIEQRLASWLAGRDATFDLGELMGIVSQPRRPSWAEVRALTGEDRTRFETHTLGGLDTLATAQEAALAEVEAALNGLPADDPRRPWIEETRDGLEITALRARFSAALARTVLADADGDTMRRDARLSDAARLRSEALAVANRRHAASWSHRAADIVAARRRNAGLYQYGYLREATDLCFWRREEVQVTNLVRGETASVPACVL